MPAALHAVAQAFRKSRIRVPRCAPRKVREEKRDDAAELAAELLHALDLRGQGLRERRREIDHAALVVLDGARIEAQRALGEIELPALEHQDLVLHPPAVGVGNVRDDLQIRREVAAHRLILLRLEEALPRARFLELLEHGKAHQLAVLVGQAEHPAEDGELPIDPPVRRGLGLALGRVLGRLDLADRHDPSTGEEWLEVR